MQETPSQCAALTLIKKLCEAAMIVPAPKPDPEPPPAQSFQTANKEDNTTTDNKNSKNDDLENDSNHDDI